MSIRSIVFTVLLVAVGPFSSPASAVIIAQEGFSYGLGELGGQNGGDGFAAPWVASAGQTEIVDPGSALAYSAGGLDLNGGDRALQVSGNGDNIAFRPLANSIDTDELFVSFLFRYSGTLNNNDFGVLWHDDVSTGSHTDRPNLGIKANRGTGGGPEDVVARLQLSGSGQAYAVDLVAGQTYFILGRLYRTTPGAGNDYDRFDVWVNPTAGASGTPDLTATGSGGVSSFGMIGFRAVNLDSGDALLFDEIRYSDSFVTATTPEPGSGVLLGFGLALLAARRRTIA